eukprot:10587033-Ditylum_brightwellii.AAC.1
MSTTTRDDDNNNKATKRDSGIKDTDTVSKGEAFPHFFPPPAPLSLSQQQSFLSLSSRFVRDATRGG